MSLTLRVGLSILCLLVTSSRAHAVPNIFQMLETCATNDPAYPQIRADFEIRRNGVPVGAIACSEPISALPLAQYTNELIAVQVLRVIYYMDFGRSLHLPWTPLRFYDWMASKVDGIDIRDGSPPSCCFNLDGKLFFRIPAIPDADRDFDREFRGIASWIAIYGHEVRHVDGFPHDGSCGPGTDPVFDLANLSAFGVHWYVYSKLLSGSFYVGLACTDPGTTSFLASHLALNANVIRSTFCASQPPELGTPAEPGGSCRDGAGCGGQPVTILGTFENDFITGTPGNDVIKGFGGDDTIKGRGGDDLICGGGGNDVLKGGGGSDFVNGNGGNDTVKGGSGDDLVKGGNGDDLLKGGDGTDTCDGGDGTNTIDCP